MHTPHITKRQILKTAAVLVVIAGVITVLEVTNTTHFFHKDKPVSGSAYTKGETTNSKTQTSTTTAKTSNQTSSSDPNSEPGDQKSNPGGGTPTATLLAPSGDFVSNHHPNLGNQPAPNTISSVCTTTPGATCTISFSKDGIVKSLAAEVTDRGGSAYWNWKLQDIGLTVGNWDVKATATLNGQTKSASDALQLVIAQ